MQILLDHNTPAPLRHSLQGRRVETAYERGWAELTNGELLAAAESAGFDLMIHDGQKHPVSAEFGRTKARADCD